MTNRTRTDRQILAHHYASDDKLAVRYRTHELYTVPKIDFIDWVLRNVAWRGDEWVLDLGAGPGLYFEPVKKRIPHGRHFAVDLSFGMVKRQLEQEAHVGSGLFNADAQALPFADGVFDIVLANHMLYHVPDLDQAIAEIHRVLRPEGLLVAATNSINNMPEINTLYRRALLLLTEFEYNEELPRSDAATFSLENGSAILGRHFFAVARYDLPSALVFQHPEPVLAYLDSMRDIREPQLPGNVTWEAYMDIMHQQVARLIDHSGRLVVKKLAGVMVATDAGGFAADYVCKLRSQPG